MQDFEGDITGWLTGSLSWK